MWLRCTFLFAFILDLHTTKTLTMLLCAAFACKHDSARYYRELSFLCPLEKQIVVKQWIQNCRRYARLSSVHFEESYFEADIFSSTNG